LPATEGAKEIKSDKNKVDVKRNDPIDMLFLAFDDTI
jgi:hypothetical protein